MRCSATERGMSFALPIAGSVLLILAGCTSVKTSEVAWPSANTRRIPDLEIPAPYGLTGPLTLQSAIERAIEANPGIQSQKAAVEVARKAVGAVKDWDDPQLRFSYGESESDSLSTSSGTENLVNTGITEGGSTTPAVPASNSGESGESFQDSEGYRVAFRLYPPNPWERAAEVSGARADLYAAQASLQFLRAQTAYEVRKAYAEFQFADEDVKVLDRLLTVSKSLVEITNKLLERGQGTVLDSMNASRRYLAALSDRDQRIRERDDALGQLAGLISLPAESLEVRHENVTLGSLDPMTVDLHKLEDTAMRYRGDLVAAGWTVRAARAAYDAAKAARIPWLAHVQASYSSAEDQSESWSREEEVSLDGTVSRSQVGESEDDNEEWRVDAAIRLPIFTWIGRTDDLRKAELKHAETLEMQALMDMKQDIRNRVDRLKRLDDQRARFEMAADPVTEEIWKVLDNSRSGQNLPPDQIARMKEQLLDISRIKLQAEFERTVTMLAIEAEMGITAVPVAAGE
ncbi:MAG: TolC family protein [Kiritimatiellia bacterium]|nr:TolC family protein [Kiritimatiellia bacterium]MDP6847985.1 TolC family protein [Kiritimatiellia bacterium]